MGRSFAELVQSGIEGLVCFAGLEQVFGAAMAVAIAGVWIVVKPRRQVV